MAEYGAHLTPTPNEERPSIFEVLAQESLTSTLRPALKYIIRVGEAYITVLITAPKPNLSLFCLLSQTYQHRFEELKHPVANFDIPVNQGSYFIFIHPSQSNI